MSDERRMEVLDLDGGGLPRELEVDLDQKVIFISDRQKGDTWVLIRSDTSRCEVWTEFGTNDGDFRDARWYCENYDFVGEISSTVRVIILH